MGRSTRLVKTVYLYNSSPNPQTATLLDPPLKKFVLDVPRSISVPPGITPYQIAVVGDSTDLPWVEDFVIRFVGAGSQPPIGWTDFDYSDWNGLSAGEATAGQEAFRVEVSAHVLPTGDERFGPKIKSHVDNVQTFTDYIASGMGSYSREYKDEKVNWAASLTHGHALWALNRQYLFDPRYGPMRHAENRARAIGYAPPGIGQFPPAVRRRVLSRSFEIVRNLGTAEGYKLAFEALGVSVAGIEVVHDSLNFVWRIRLPVYAAAIFDLDYLGTYALYHTDAYNVVDLALKESPEAHYYTELDYTAAPVPPPLPYRYGRMEAGTIPYMQAEAYGSQAIPLMLTVNSPANNFVFREYVGAGDPPTLTVSSPGQYQQFISSEGSVGDVDFAELTYTEDPTVELMNPERGWHGNISDRGGFPAIRSNGMTLNRWLVRLDAFRNAAITTTWLNNHRADYQAARTQGIKLLPRYTYNFDWVSPDAPLHRILQHIGQLSPIWHEYEDVIASFQAGFIGAWGEWHSSTHGLTDADPSARNQVIEALLDALPPSVMLNLRYPEAHIEYLGDMAPLDPFERFTGTDQARLGLLNDSFLANQTDGGTFVRNRYTEDYVFDEPKKTYWRQISRFVVASGETVDLSWRDGNREAPLQAMNEMEQFSWDQLNRDYSSRVIDRWIAEGYFDEISRRLGYRLHLESARLPVQAPAGTVASITLEFVNNGWGKVYKPPPIVLHFVPDSGPSVDVQLTADARRDLPLGMSRNSVAYSFIVPPNLAGTYELWLSLPDPSPNLANDPRFSIRLANVGMWSQSSGRHSLGALFTVGSGPAGRPSLFVASPAQGEQFADGSFRPTLTVSVPVQNQQFADGSFRPTLTVSVPAQNQQFVDTSGGLHLDVTSPLDGQEFIEEAEEGPQPLGGWLTVVSVHDNAMSAREYDMSEASPSLTRTIPLPAALPPELMASVSRSFPGVSAISLMGMTPDPTPDDPFNAVIHVILPVGAPPWSLDRSSVPGGLHIDWGASINYDPDGELLVALASSFRTPFTGVESVQLFSESGASQGGANVPQDAFGEPMNTDAAGAIAFGPAGARRYVLGVMVEVDPPPIPRRLRLAGLSEAGDLLWIIPLDTDIFNTKLRRIPGSDSFLMGFNLGTGASALRRYDFLNGLDNAPTVAWEAEYPGFIMAAEVVDGRVLVTAQTLTSPTEPQIRIASLSLGDGSISYNEDTGLLSPDPGDFESGALFADLNIAVREGIAPIAGLVANESRIVFVDAGTGAVLDNPPLEPVGTPVLILWTDSPLPLGDWE